MRRRFVLGLPLALGACAAAEPRSGFRVGPRNGPLDGFYDGADAGYLITALTAERGGLYTSYDLRFRKRDRGDDSAIWWGAGDTFDARHPDIADDIETGIVEIRPLPPGDYEIFNFDLDFTGGLGVVGQIAAPFRHDTAAQDFAIPFTIRPGEGTYIGEFMAVLTNGQNVIGASTPKGGYFLLSNKLARDAPIARARQPRIGPIRDMVIDPQRAGTPAVRATFLPQQQ